MRKNWILVCLTFLSLSCNREGTTKINVTHIPMEINIDRFDQIFYAASPENLPVIKKQFPRFFPVEVPDSIWMQKIADKDEQELYAETQKVYQRLDEVENSLILLFKHVKYYFPNFTVPKITTVLSNIDYEYRIILDPQDLIISLDLYLGKDHEFYNDFPDYIKENNTQEYIQVDVAMAIIESMIPRNSDRTFLGKMIYEGKKKYLLDVLLPNMSEKRKSGYSKEKLQWAIANEEQVWKYFIEKKLLFSTDSDLDKRFLDLAPFSKFYLKLDNDSPGQIGVWMGWQLVRSFMEKNDVSLSSLLEIKSEELFKKSKYKPRS